MRSPGKQLYIAVQMLGSALWNNRWMEKSKMSAIILAVQDA